jgi:ankyrin repeat protein
MMMNYSSSSSSSSTVSVQIPPLKKRRIASIHSQSGQQQQQQQDDITLPDPHQNHTPIQFLQELFRSMYGYSLNVKPSSSIKEESKHFFVSATEDEVAAYTTEVLTVVRSNDLQTLKQMHSTGQANLKCTNQFGESLLHLACRRGFHDMVTLLLDNDVPVRITDDCGRNPLHDVCWNPTPQLAICRMLFERDPVLFFISDSRGFTPFDYARAEHFLSWKKFLLDNRHHLRKLVDDKETISMFSATTTSKKESSHD